MKLGQQCAFLIPIGNNEDRFGTGVILELGQKIKVPSLQTQSREIHKQFCVIIKNRLF